MKDNEQNANIDINEWTPIDMDAAERVAARVKAEKEPTVAKVERLADATYCRPDPLGYGPGYDETKIRLKVTMTNGRAFVKEFGVHRSGRLAVLAMRAKGVIGMTADELGSFLVRFDDEYLGEYERLDEAASEKAEYERLKKKFG